MTKSGSENIRKIHECVKKIKFSEEIKALSGCSQDLINEIKKEK